MPDGVVNEIDDQAFHQVRVTCCRRRSERGVDADPMALGIVLAGRDYLAGDASEVQRFCLRKPALAVGQGEQRRDEALLLSAQFHQFLTGCTQCLHGGFGVGDRDLEQGPPGAERGPQLVGGVGDEVPLRLERSFQAGEQVIECFPEFGELVVPAAQAKAPVQVAGRDVPGGGDDRAQGPHEPPGDQPAECQGEHGHDRHGGHGGPEGLGTDECGEDAGGIPGSGRAGLVRCW